MSCGCNSNPCVCKKACDPANEAVSSQLNNFITQFFGTLTKTCVNNQVVWTLPCDLDDGLPCYPRLPNEGLACYFLRIFDLFGLVASGEWDANVTYCKNALVTFDGSAYIALANTLGNQPDTSPASWLQYVAQGPAGPAGSSPLTTKGDIFTYSTTDDRLPIGIDGQVLTADSTQVTGNTWSTPIIETASNLGAGNGVFASKVGVDFQFKSLIAGSNITLTPSGTDITIASAGAGLFTLSFTSANQVITSAGALTLAHGMAATPTLAQVRIKNTTAEHGYSIGDEVILPIHQAQAGADCGVALTSDATNVYIRYGNTATTFVGLNKTTGVYCAFTNANWQFIVKAWA